MADNNILLKNGRIIDPGNQKDEIGDLLIESGKIAQIGGKINADGKTTVIDINGQWLMPGFIDSFASVGEPGREDIETILEGADRAARSGFIGLFLLPSSEPAIDNQALVKYIISEGKKSPIYIFPMGAATKGCAGNELAEMNELKKAGCIAFSNGRHSIESSLLMRRALEYSDMVDSPILSFPDDPNLTNDGFAHEGFTATELGLKGAPGQSEEIAIMRDLILQQLTGAQVHIGPITYKGSIERLKLEKIKSKRIFSFTAAHYLFLNDTIMHHILGEGKVFPPFRTEIDRLALIQACKEGIIDFLVSDHTPHLPYEMNQELLYAPFGISSLETTVAVAVESLVYEAGANPSLIARLFSSNVNKAYNLPFGSIQIGTEANLTIIDPKTEIKVTKELFQGRTDNSPFIGQKLRGFPSLVISKGKISFKRSI